jgi:PTS system mannose-specific IIC component
MELLRLSVLGGLLGLDGTAVGQFMVSRPLVAGTLTGWLVGDPALGAAIGAVLELYLLVSFPTGGSRFPEGSAATVVAVSVAAPFSGPGAVAMATAVGLVWGQIGGVTVTLQRKANGRLVPPAEAAGPRARRLSTAHLLAIGLDLARGSALTFTGVLAGRTVLRLVDHRWPLTDSASDGLLLVGAAVSAGVLLHDLGGFRRRRMLFAAGLALGILGARVL